MEEGFTHYLVPKDDLERLVDAFVTVSVRGHEKKKHKAALVLAMRSQYMRVKTRREEVLAPKTETES